MAMNVNSLVVKFLADTTQFNSQMKSMEGNLASFSARLSAQAKATNNTFTSIGGNLTTMGTAFQKTGATLTRSLTAPLALIGMAAVKTGIDFETAFAGVKKTIDATPAEFARLATIVQNIAMQTGTDVKQVAASMQMAGQLGIRGEIGLERFTRTVSELAIATSMSAEPIAMMLGKFAAITGLNVEEDIAKVGAAIAHLGNNTATTEKDILKFAVRMGATGSLVGMTSAEILALSAATEASGTKAERGGTALTKILLKMQQEALGGAKANTTYKDSLAKNNAEIKKWEGTLADLQAQQQSLGSDATSAEMQNLSDKIITAQENLASLRDTNESFQDTLKDTGTETMKFSKFLGITDAEFSKLFKDKNGGAAKVFQMFLDRVGKGFVGEEQVGDLLKQLGLSDTRLVQTVLSLAKSELSKTSSSYSSAMANAQIAFAEATSDWSGALNREVVKRLDTVSGQFGILRESLKTIATIFTGESNNALKEFLKQLNLRLIPIIDYLRNNPEAVSKITKAFLGLMALGPGMSLFGGVLKSFGTSFNLLGVAIGAFKADEGISGLAKLGSAVSNFKQKTGSLMGGRGTGSGWVINNLPRVPKGQGALYGQPAGSWLRPGTPGYDLAMKNKVPIEKKGLFGNLQKEKWVKGPLDTGKYKDEQGKWRSKETGRFTSAPNWKNPEGLTQQITRKKTLFGKASEVKDTVAVKMNNVLGVMQSRMQMLLAMSPKWFQGLLSGFGQVLPIVNGVAMALGGWAVVIGLIAIGLAALFVGLGKNSAQVTEIFDNITIMIRDFSIKISLFMVELIDTLIPNFLQKMGEILPAVLSGMDAVVSQLIQSFWLLLPQILEVISTVLVGIVDLFSANLPQILDMLIGWVVKFLDGFLKNLPGMLTSVFNVLTSVVTAFFEALPQLFVAAVELIWLAFDTIMSADWETIIDTIFKGIGDVLAGIVIGLIEGVNKTFPGLFEAVGKFFKDAFTGISDTVYAAGVAIVKGLMDGIVWYWNNVFVGAFTIGVWLVGLLSKASTWLYESGKAILKGAWDGLWWYWSNVFKGAFNISKWIIDMFAGAGSWLYDAGKNVVQGLLDGVGNMAATIGSWFLNKLPDWMIGPFKWALGIKSPSRVFAGFGEMIGQGLINGMDSMQGQVMGASDALAEATLIDPMALNQAIGVTGGSQTQDYSGLAIAFAEALKTVGLEVYMDGKKVTDVVSTELALEQRRTK